MESNLLFPNLEELVHPKGEVEVSIYVDEIKKFKNSCDEFWMYIGLLFIKSQDRPQVLGDLLHKRKAIGYHDELHFAELTNYSYSNIYSEKTRLARSWMELILSEGCRRKIYFHIVGLNLSNLEYEVFGPGQDRKRNIYNRFFRCTTLYCLKSYFREYAEIIVKQIFHDRGHLETDELFDWHAIWRIEAQEQKISFDNKNILFVDSDHDKEKKFPEESHFIQLTDLVLGATVQCLDAGKNRDGCNEIAEMFIPLVERLNDVNRINNPNSRYDYCRKCGVSFFPRCKLTGRQFEDKWERLRSGFFLNRPIILKERLSGQERLF